MRYSPVYMVLLLVMATACNNQPGAKTPASDSHDHHSRSAMPVYEKEADYADSVNQGLIVEDTLKGSPERMAMANIGKSHVHIEYHSPGVKNRIIWGGLVPYGQVWVSGAHNATSINFSGDVTIMGKLVKAGTYAFFTIPDKEYWTIILNSRYDQHLTDEYDQKEDVVRLQVKPIYLDKNVPRLTYEVVSETDSGGNVILTWEKTKIMLPVVAKSNK